MTETTDSPAAPKRRPGGLNSMLLADLKAMATGMGIASAGSMKKAQLVEAIKTAQATPRTNPPTAPKTSPKAATKSEPVQANSQQAAEPESTQQRPPRARGAKKVDSAAETSANPEKSNPEKSNPEKSNPEKSAPEKSTPGQATGGKSTPEKTHQGKATAEKKPDQSDQPQAKQTPPDGGDPSDAGLDEEGRAGRNRRRRGRDRSRTTGPAQGTTGAQGGNQGSGSQGGHQGGHRNEPDTTILEDDVLVPAAGILDVLDNYAFVRTSGYLAGTDDVYVSLSMVRKFGLRRGDAVAGQVRQPREGERKEKFNPMVRVDSVNGAEPGQALHRPDFATLTPLSPTYRLRMETGPDNLVGRMIDIAAPLGKGQRGLIVAPAGAGKTMMLQSIASSITANNPECHLMVVLIDARPEEVTDFQRSVKGEVISSAFDRTPLDHTTVAELAIERAKRLVELGLDVVVLLDGLTRLGRAYNLSAPASGRVFPGGVDAAALHPIKRFVGAARNIENGGSLTMVATALVETGSTTDEVIFEELSGTSNLEIRLRRELADHRQFPAIDATQSGTRHDDLLLGAEELAIVSTLRRALGGLDVRQAHELLVERLRRTQTNIEFLMQVQKKTPTPGTGD